MGWYWWQFNGFQLKSVKDFLKKVTLCTIIIST